MSRLKPSYTSGQPSQRLPKVTSVLAKASTKAPWYAQSGESVMQACLVFTSLEEAMAWASCPHPVECPSGQGAHAPLLYLSPFTCALHRTPSSPPDQCQEVGQAGAVVLYCFYTGHLRISGSPSVRSRHAPSLRLAVGRPPAAELQSILQLEQGNKYTSSIPRYKTLSLPPARSWAISFHLSFEL